MLGLIQLSGIVSVMPWFDVHRLCPLLLCVLSSLAEAMSDEELQEKSLGVAKHTLNGKSDLERATILHQHIGSRAMGDMVIETFEPSPGELTHLAANEMQYVFCLVLAIAKTICLCPVYFKLGHKSVDICWLPPSCFFDEFVFRP